MLVGAVVFRRDRQVHFLVRAPQDQFGKKPMLRRVAKRLGRLGNSEFVMTVLARCRCSTGRAFLGIEPEATGWTVDFRILDVSRKNSAASGTADTHFGFAVWIRIARKDVGREQVNALR